MYDRIAMDLRVREHVEQTQRVNRCGLDHSEGLIDLAGLRVFAAHVLLRLSEWLAPGQVQRTAPGKTATA